MTYPAATQAAARLPEHIWPDAPQHVTHWLWRQRDAGHITHTGTHGLMEALAVRSCPSCGADAVYAPPLDRYLHADGSDNDACWRVCLQLAWDLT